MPHNISLITTIAAALGFGLLFGMLAVRLRLPALVGYLAAGVIIGPATPGFVADVALAGLGLAGIRDLAHRRLFAVRGDGCASRQREGGGGKERASHRAGLAEPGAEFTPSDGCADAIPFPGYASALRRLRERSAHDGGIVVR